MNLYNVTLLNTRTGATQTVSWVSDGSPAKAALEVGRTLDATPWAVFRVAYAWGNET